MKHLIRRVASLSAAVLLAAAAAAAGRADPPVRSGVAVRSVTVESEAMGGRWPAVVLLPAAYRAEPDRRFPVLYLLHGAGDDHLQWLRATSLKRLLEIYPIICVCPNGRTHGWYLDSPRMKGSNVETHITGELVPFVDRSFRTIASREGRGICGNSMGGHGAVTLAAKYPDMFASASSLSGIMDISRWPDNWYMSRVLGPLRSDPRLWRSHSAFGRVQAFTEKAAGVRLFIDCGVDDYAYEENLEFHEILKRSGVRHAYMERPGSHRWSYWSGQLVHHLIFHLRSLRRSSEARSTHRRSPSVFTRLDRARRSPPVR